MGKKYDCHYILLQTYLIIFYVFTLILELVQVSPATHGMSLCQLTAPHALPLPWPRNKEIIFYTVQSLHLLTFYSANQVHFLLGRRKPRAGGEHALPWEATSLRQLTGKSSFARKLPEHIDKVPEKG